jgi:subtilisin family serine protease
MDFSYSLEDARHALHEGTGAGVRVAVLDSGVELRQAIFESCEFDNDLAVVAEYGGINIAPGEAKDYFGHGTAIAAIIHKLAPKATIGSIRVLGPNLSSRTDIIRRGVQEAIDQGYNVLNCSFGCKLKDQVLQYKDWIDEAFVRGIHVVAACNNYDFSVTEWPAYFPSVISVNMARVADDTSLYRVPGTLIEFAARGVDVPVAWLGGTEQMLSGSSFAAPVITGLLVRMLSGLPELDPLEAKSFLRKLASPLTAEMKAANML